MSQLFQWAVDLEGGCRERLQGDRAYWDQHRVLGGCRRDGGENSPETLRDLRVAEVVEQDIHVDGDGGITYRTKLRLSFKYEGRAKGSKADSDLQPLLVSYAGCGRSVERAPLRVRHRRSQFWSKLSLFSASASVRPIVSQA